ncbi:MAG TPA: PQQ-binding-like beta-propeller repeat protein [Pirellulales bacterium]|nr:PQQ-binding-like beta-propeller repeat protein [Pirellulales bacterium]
MILAPRLADRRLPGRWLQQATRLAAALLAWVALPYAWQRSVGLWLQYGLDGGAKFYLATLGLWCVLAALSYRLRRVRSLDNADAAPCRVSSGKMPLLLKGQLGAMLALLACWCAVQAALWQLWSSQLNAAPGLGALFATSTLWVFWTWAKLFAAPIRFRHAPAFGATLLLAATAVSCLQANGLDGAGRVVIGYRSAAWRDGRPRPSITGRDGRPRPSIIGRDGRPRPSAETARRAGAPVPPFPTALAPPHANAPGSPSYPCFRGAEGLGVVPEARLSGDWSAFPPRTVWRQPVAAGWSGFAIDAGQAFTQGQLGDEEIVVCYELASGRQQWLHADRVRFASPTAGDGPRATPAVAGDCVYTLGATGLLNCLDRRTGRRRWSVDVLVDNDAGNSMHGLSSSPLVVDDVVVVGAGGKQGKSLAAYDRASGRRVWRAGDDPAGYGSPLVCTLARRRQIVILNRPGLAAHDAETGRVLWTFPWTNSTETNCSQPVPAGDNRLFISSGYGKGCALVSVELSENGDWNVRPLWTSRSLKTKFASAVLYDGRAYGLDDGILCCVDLADGRRRWKAGRYGHGQVLLAGDKLLVQCESGEVALVAADPAGHRELGRFAALAGKTWNYPALAGRWLLCRNDREAACFELRLIEDVSNDRRTAVIWEPQRHRGTETKTGAARRGGVNRHSQQKPVGHALCGVP